MNKPRSIAPNYHQRNDSVHKMDWSNERWSNSESFCGTKPLRWCLPPACWRRQRPGCGLCARCAMSSNRIWTRCEAVQHRPRHRRGHQHIARRCRRGGSRMAAAERTRSKQRGQCAKSRQLVRWGCVLFWCAVWVWFGARTLRAANRVLACQQFGCACLHAACLGARLKQLQRR